MKDNRTRLFEVMSRLDKTFKAPKLNEEFEPASPVAFKQPMGGEVGGSEVETEKNEQTPEEKLEALTTKVDELYALLHGEEESSEESGEESGVESLENLQEWNFDKKKGEKEDDTKEHEDSETPAEEKAEHEKGGEEELKEETSTDAPKAKIPVNAIAKVGK